MSTSVKWDWRDAPDSPRETDNHTSDAALLRYVIAGNGGDPVPAVIEGVGYSLTVARYSLDGDDVDHGALVFMLANIERTLEAASLLHVRGRDALIAAHNDEIEARKVVEAERGRRIREKTTAALDALAKVPQARRSAAHKRALAAVEAIAAECQDGAS